MSLLRSLKQRIQHALETPFDNSTNGFVSDDVQGAIEELSTSASPGFSFGRGNNVTASTWLYRVGQVPSNKTGVTFGYDNGSLDIINVGTENLDTYTLEIYYHDGDEINLTLITTVNIVSSRAEVLLKDVDFTITNAPAKNKQIAVKISSGSARNLGVDLQLSGTE